MRGIITINKEAVLISGENTYYLREIIQEYNDVINQKITYGVRLSKVDWLEKEVDGKIKLVLQKASHSTEDQEITKPITYTYQEIDSFFELIRKDIPNDLTYSDRYALEVNTYLLLSTINDNIFGIGENWRIINQDDLIRDI